MGLLIIFGVLAILGFVAGKFINEDDHFTFTLNVTSCVVAFVFTLCFLIGGCVAIANNANPKENYQMELMQAQMIQAQADANVYDNDNDVGKYELYQQIVDWNTSLVYKKAITHNPWFGIFYPDYVDDLPYITFGSDLPFSLSEVTTANE